MRARMCPFEWITATPPPYRVIDLGRKVRDYYDTELPKRHPHYPPVGPDEETAPPPPEEGELRDFLASLPDEHGFGFHVLWQSGRPDRARASLHTYTIGYLEQDEPGNDHVSELLKPGDAIAVKVDGGPLH